MTIKENGFLFADIVRKSLSILKGVRSTQTKYRKFGKWSPSWEGPYRVVEILLGNPYFVQSLQREKLPKALDGK
jgi:hypothetical protein